MEISRRSLEDLQQSLSLENPERNPESLLKRRALVRKVLILEILRSKFKIQINRRGSLSAISCHLQMANTICQIEIKQEMSVFVHSLQTQSSDCTHSGLSEESGRREPAEC